jgi:hypothetical protein
VTKNDVNWDLGFFVCYCVCCCIFCICCCICCCTCCCICCCQYLLSFFVQTETTIFLITVNYQLGAQFPYFLKYVYSIPLHVSSTICSSWWAEYLSRYSDWLRTARFGDRIPLVAKFSVPVQTGPGSHPASSTMGTGSFPGVNYGRGVLLTNHPFQCRGHGRVELNLYPPSGPHRACNGVTSPFYMLIIRRIDCINTASGIVTLCKCLVSARVKRGLSALNLCTDQPLTVSDDTRCCINTIYPPDDEHIVFETCRGM